MTKTLKIPAKLTREAAILTLKNGERAGMFLSVSSDEPYLRYDWFTGEEYYEVLDHAAVDETRLKAGLPILFNHDRNAHLGRATDFTNDGKRITLDMEKIKWASGAIAQEKKADMESGALPDTSVGYEITGDGECIGAKDGKPVIKFPWRIFEASAVTIPADITVGVARQRSDDDSQGIVEISVAPGKIEAQPESTSMTTEPKPEDTKPEAATPEATPKPAVADIASERAAAVADFKARAKKITDWAEAQSGSFREKAREVARKHIDGEANFNDFREEALNSFEKAKPIATGDAPAGESLSRSQFGALTPHEQRAHVLRGGKVTD